MYRYTSYDITVTYYTSNDMNVHVPDLHTCATVGVRQSDQLYGAQVIDENLM